MSLEQLELPVLWVLRERMDCLGLAAMLAIPAHQANKAKEVRNEEAPVALATLLVSKSETSFNLRCFFVIFSGLQLLS